MASLITDDDLAVYFDVAVKNTSTFFLSLHNVPRQLSRASEPVSSPTAYTSHKLNVVHVPFRPVSLREQPSPPISLLARVDQEEYILLPNASALVTICNHDLSENDEHYIRIIAPMTDNNGTGIVELEGIWLSKGGQLVRIEGTYSNEDLDHEESGQVSRVKMGEHSESHDCREDGKCNAEDASLNEENRKKMLEVITDSPGSVPGSRRFSRTGGADGLLAGVMGWEYLLGEIFGADHVDVGVDGMCLTQDCIGGVGQPNGIGDVFFRRLVCPEKVLSRRGLVQRKPCPEEALCPDEVLCTDEVSRVDEVSRADEALLRRSFAQTKLCPDEALSIVQTRYCPDEVLSIF